MSNNRTALATLAALALSAAPALAQNASQNSSSGSGASSGGRFSRHNTVTPAPSYQSSGSISMMNKTDGGDTYQVVISDGKISAKVNGEDVPEDRVRRSDDKVELLDKDGNVLTTFDVHVAHAGALGGMGGMGGGGKFSVMSGPNGSFAIGGPAQGGPAPKVMLGVTMVEPSESLTEHLDLEPGTGVLLNSVMDNLPADKAGLKKGDVIVSFDGVKPITVTKARELLAKKAAGDKVQVVVLRKGDEKTVTVELQRFDAAKLSSEEQAARAAMGGGDEARNTLRKQIDEATKQGMQWGGTATPGSGNNWVFSPGQDKFEIFSSPGTPEMKERMAALDKKLSDLDDKMSKLDDQLSRLEKKLDKLNSR